MYMMYIYTYIYIYIYIYILRFCIGSCLIFKYMQVICLFTNNFFSRFIYKLFLFIYKLFIYNMHNT